MPRSGYLPVSRRGKHAFVTELLSVLSISSQRAPQLYWAFNKLRRRCPFGRWLNYACFYGSIKAFLLIWGMLKRISSSLVHPHRAIKLFTLLPIGFVYCVHFRMLYKKKLFGRRREEKRKRCLSLSEAQMVPCGLDRLTTQMRRTADRLACGMETTEISPLDMNFAPSSCHFLSCR